MWGNTWVRRERGGGCHLHGLLLLLLLLLPGSHIPERLSLCREWGQVGVGEGVKTGFGEVLRPVGRL